MEISYDSQSQAAAALGVKIEKIQEAKRSGCTAFRSGRVYREPLLAFFKANPDQETPSQMDTAGDDERSLRLRERKAAVGRLELKLSIERRETIKVSEVKTALSLTIGAFDSALKQLAGRVAEKLIHQTRAAFMAMLNAELTEKQFAKLKGILESSHIDYGSVVRVLDDEVEALRAYLNPGDWLRPMDSEEYDE